MINIKLTEEEAEVVSDYIFRKVCRLEDAKLEDSYCYPRLYGAYRKLFAALNIDKKEDQYGNRKN